MIHPVGEEWQCWAGFDGDVQVFLTITDAAGHFAIRSSNTSGRPAMLAVTLLVDDQTKVLEVPVPQGFWPGPTAAQKRNMGGRLIQDMNFSFSAGH